MAQADVVLENSYIIGDSVRCSSGNTELQESAMVDSLAALVRDTARSYICLLHKEQQACDMATD